MAEIYNTIHNCGIRELGYVADSDIRSCVLEAKKSFRGSHIFFSVTADYKKHGLKLAAFIKAKKLGTVVKAKENLNPRSGNKITMWVWAVNKKKLAAFK